VLTVVDLVTEFVLCGACHLQLVVCWHWW